jgi:kynurenine 3-monooxygenase
VKKRRGRSERVAIIGAGISSLALVPLLAQRGYEVIAFEKRRHLNELIAGDGRSIGLALSFRGIRAMRRLGLGRQIDSLTVPMRGRCVHGLDRMDLQRYDLVGNRTIFSIRRDTLLEQLFELAASFGQIHFGTECVAVRTQPARIRLRDSTDTERIERFDGLVGADGAASVVRREILRDLQQRVAAVPYSHAYKELTIPAAAARRSRLDHNALHIWPRHDFMLIALPNRDGSFIGTLFLPRLGTRSLAALRTEREVERFFVRYFPDAWPLFPALMEEFFANPIGRICTVRSPHWSKGRAVIIGDAAHAMVPFYGQGMNCALEDCLELDGCIAGQPTLESAFETFASNRRRDAEAIALLSVENYREMRGLDDAVDLANTRRIEAILQLRYPERYMPLYAMVSFTAIPYYTIRHHAKVQFKILEELRKTTPPGKPLELSVADSLVLRNLQPLPELDGSRPEAV